MKNTILFLMLISFSGLLQAQQLLSNKGNDFWVAYGYHMRMNSSSALNTQEMVLYFATDQVTNITITTSTGYTETLVSPATPGVISSSPLPKMGTEDLTLKQESTIGEDKGIHIISDKPMFAYAHIYNSSVSGATLLFPTNTLGRTYYSINYTQTSNEDFSNCWFYVIATETGTSHVRITPSAETINHPAGVPFDITLSQGQVFNVMGQLTGGSVGSYTGVDLTGSKIESIGDGVSPPKNIAVFSGSGKINITCGGATQNSADNYMVQSFPDLAWGKQFLTVPTSVMTNNFFRICVREPNTNVLLNGAPIAVPLNGDFYYEISANTPQKIEADKPITIAQYITTRGSCDNPNTTNGDPEVVYLSPIEQNMPKVIWNSTPNFDITEHYVNAVIPNSGSAISSFKLDGVNVPDTEFTVHPQDSRFSYLSKLLPTSGTHIMESDSAFNTIAYGYGSAESYGYNAGSFVFILCSAVISSTNGPICTGSDAVFNISGTPGAIVTYTLNGNPGTLTLDASGQFTMTINNATSDQTLTLSAITTTACSEVLNESSTIVVRSIPFAFFVSNNGPLCTGSDAIFNLAGTPNATISYSINGNPGSIVADATGNATITINNATAQQSLTLNAVFNGSCTQTFTGINSTLIVNPRPTVTVNNPTVCSGSAATISASVVSPNPVTLSWTVPTGVPNPGNISTFNTSSAGIYTVIATNNSNNCPSAPANATVSVNTLPVVTVSSNNGPVCIGSAGSFQLNGTPGASVSYNINANPGSCMLDASGAAVVTVPNQTENQTMVLLSCSLGSCSQTISSTPPNIPNFEPPQVINGKAFYMSLNTLNYFNAKNIAESLGGKLACMSNAAENQLLSNMASQNASSPWIGYAQNSSNPNYTEPLGGWEWADGSTYVPSFAGGEPNDCGSCCGEGHEDFAQMYTNGTLNDLCSQSLNFFIIQLPISIGSTITVTPTRVPSFAPRGPYCKDDIIPTVTLPSTSTEGIFGVWNPVSVSTANAGNSVYTFTPNAGQCAQTTTLSVVVNPLPTGVTAGPSATIANGTAVTLQGAGSGNYSWLPVDGLSNPLVATPLASPGATTIYTLTVENSFGCKLSDSLIVTIANDCLEPMKIFTPNNDGIYDLWVVLDGSCVKKVEANVYNRYGGLVYHSNDYKNNWNGSYNGKVLPDATYYYILKISDISGKTYVRKGSVTIMR